MFKKTPVFVKSYLSKRTFNITTQKQTACDTNIFNIINRRNTSTIFSSNKQIRLFDKEIYKQLIVNKQTVLFNFSTSLSQNLDKEWTSILTEAGKIVGYSTSLLNWRHLVSDEVSHFTNLLRKLIQTKHPLIKMASKLIVNSDTESRNGLQMNGLVVLLISKVAGLPHFHKNAVESEISDGIHNSQRCLAEITEMIYMGSIIHKGVLDLKHVRISELTDMDQGNKLAVLCGDYLLANACKNLAMLNNTEVVDLMSEVIADMSQGSFVNNNNDTKNYQKLWYDHMTSNTASLLANSAKSALLLVEHSSKTQQIAWMFANNLDIAHKIWFEIVNFKKENITENKVESILNAIYKDKYQSSSISRDSIAHAIETNNKNNTFSSAISKSKKILSSLYSTGNISTDKNIIETVSSNVTDDGKVLFLKHYDLAIENLEQLKNENSASEPFDCLKSMLQIMKNTI